MNGLEKIRTSRGMTQSELASRVGCTRLSIYRWERGQSSPTGDNLMKLAAALEVTPNELLGVGSGAQ